jgi:hypothetical protein
MPYEIYCEIDEITFLTIILHYYMKKIILNSTDEQVWYEVETVLVADIDVKYRKRVDN